MTLNPWSLDSSDVMQQRYARVFLSRNDYWTATISSNGWASLSLEVILPKLGRTASLSRFPHQLIWAVRIREGRQVKQLVIMMIVFRSGMIRSLRLYSFSFL